MISRISALALAIGSAIALTTEVAAAQQAVAGDGVWRAPRTEHGHPDIQGNWSNETLTPLQRPDGQGPILTPEEVMEIEGGVRALFEEGAQASDPDRPAPLPGGDADIFPESVLTSSFVAAGRGTGFYNTVWVASGDRVAVVNGEPRSSLITFPATGWIPEITAEARARRAQEIAARPSFGEFDHPELRPLGERCIISFGRNAGPPMLPNNFYNNNYTIIQNADHIAIMTEMIHDTRIIRLGDGPRLPPQVRPWMGDSWGRWEGETLVVETTNFHPLQGFSGNPSENLRVIERFTRISPETILYEFTVDDPSVYVEPWGGQLPMARMHDRLYEYACHEGNYAMQNVLSGARYQERRDAEAAAAGQ